MTRGRKRGRYAALLSSKGSRNKDDDEDDDNNNDNDDHSAAALAYATPHSFFPVAATLHNDVEDIGGDTDIDSDGGCDSASDASVQEERTPAQLITSMHDLIMRDWAEEEDSESGSERRSSVDDSTDDDLDYDDDDEYNVNV